jgi:hypothetical protein
MTKRVYVYFVEGKKGHRIVLSYEAAFWPNHRPEICRLTTEISDYSSMTDSLMLMANRICNIQEWPKPKILPIADFIPSQERTGK